MKSHRSIREREESLISRAARAQRSRSRLIRNVFRSLQAFYRVRLTTARRARSSRRGATGRVLQVVDHRRMPRFAA